MSSVFKRLQPADFIVTPFEAYKTWNVTSANASSSYDTYTFYGTYQTSSQLTKTENSNPTKVEYYSWPETINGEYQTSIHSAMHNAFYRRWEHSPLSTKGAFIPGQDRHQYKYIHVVAIPQRIMGDAIKPGSIQITSSQSPIIYLDDDAKGNLYDTSLSSSMSSSISDAKYLMGEWTYEDHYKNKSFLAYEIAQNLSKNGLPTSTVGVENKANSFAIKDNSKYENFATAKGNVQFYTSQSLTPYASFSNDAFGAINVPHSQRYNFSKDQDFSVSTWIRPIITQASDTNLIIGKLGSEYKYIVQTDPATGNKILPGALGYVPIMGPYPFAVTLSGSNQMNCSRYDGKSYSRVTSSATIDTGDFTHVLFQKTGSVLQLFLNGVLNSTGSDTLGGSTCNKADVWMGGIPDSASAPMYLPGQYTGFQGLYSTRIYSKALTEEETYTLYKTKYNSANVGNVFYDTGQVTVTNPSSVSGNYTGSFSYWDIFRVGANEVDTYTGWTDPTSWAYNWNLQYKSTITIHQNEILCTVPAGSFNLSFNPTLRETSTDQVGCDIMSIELLKGITTHSMFNPYSTTIGLYNDRCEMIAVAKTARPIQMINNADLTFVVRLDIDAGLGGGGTGRYPKGYEPLDPVAFVCQDGECKGLSNEDVIEAYYEAGYNITRVRGRENPTQRDIDIAKEMCEKTCGTTPDQPIEGCLDKTACNYDINATLDDGTCYYAEECKDCEGNDVGEVDCAGVCGGSAYIDNCGNCVGGNTGLVPCEPEEEDPCDGVTFPDCIGWVVHSQGVQAKRNHWISAIDPSAGTRYGRNGDAPYNDSGDSHGDNVYPYWNASARYVYFTIDTHGTSQKAYEAALKFVRDNSPNGDSQYGGLQGISPCKNNVCPCPSTTPTNPPLFQTFGSMGQPQTSYTSNCENDNPPFDGVCCPDTTGTGGGFIATGGAEVTATGELVVKDGDGSGTVNPGDGLSDNDYGNTGTTGTTGGTGTGTVTPGEEDLSDDNYGNTGTGTAVIGDSPSARVTENEIKGQDKGVTEGGVGEVEGSLDMIDVGNHLMIESSGTRTGEDITIGDNPSDNVTPNVLMTGTTSDKGDDDGGKVGIGTGDDSGALFDVAGHLTVEASGMNPDIGGETTGDLYDKAAPKIAHEIIDDDRPPSDPADGALPVGAAGSIGDLQDQIQNPDQTHANYIETGQYSSGDKSGGSNNPILTYEGIMAGNFDGDIGTQGPLEEQRKKLMVACCQRNNGEAKCCEGAGMATGGDDLQPSGDHFFVETPLEGLDPDDRLSRARMSMIGKDPDDPDSWLLSKHSRCFRSANKNSSSNAQFVKDYNACMGIAAARPQGDN